MRRFAILGVVAVALGACGGRQSLAASRPSDAVGTQPGHVGRGSALHADGNHQLAIFAQGCFWGSEHRFRQVPGVVATAVGYTGGSTADPSYESVSAHEGGHAESVLVEFDPSQVSYPQLLSLFWSSHDPTTRNRQGPDVGTNYRSAIFTLSPEQQSLALASRDAEQRHLVEPITTQISPAGPFWVAEDYHQQWDQKHGSQSCPVPHRAKRQ